MISWMQKHRKYLVITIWISTIAFVGAGFVGWGTYQYGSKSNSIAKVGNISITMQEFQTAYNNTYQQYNQALGGKLDAAIAKELGLQKQVLQRLIYQALLKNFANEYGIVVSDEEVQKSILEIKAFQKDGKFDKATYTTLLKSMGIKPKTFEENLKNEILLKKTLSLLTLGISKLELEAFGSAILMADKLRYKLFAEKDVNVDTNEDELKKYWKENKNRFLTPKRFKLAIFWIKKSNKIPDDAEIENFYKEHKNEFIDNDGKIIPLKDAKTSVIEKLQLKASKKEAGLLYIDVKKGKKDAETLKLVDVGDPMFTSEVWESIEKAETGKVLKPKVVDGRYAVIKVVEAIPPQPKTFKEAYSEVKKEFISKRKLELLQKMAEAAVNNLKDGKISDFVTRDSIDKLPSLTSDEALQFLQKLFLTNLSKGTILLNNKAVSYEILEQKLLDITKLENKKKLIETNAEKIKSNLLQNSLIRKLQQKYSIEIYLKETE